MKVHRLKTWSTPFEDVKSGMKTFEIRKNDRDYRIGDVLVLDLYNNLLREYDEHTSPLVCEVQYVMRGGRFGVAEDYVVMAIAPVEREVERVILALTPHWSAEPSSDSQEKKT